MFFSTTSHQQDHVVSWSLALRALIGKWLFILTHQSPARAHFDEPISPHISPYLPISPHSCSRALTNQSSSEASQLSCEIWGDMGDMGRYGEIWGDMGRHGEIGEIWGDMGRYGVASSGLAYLPLPPPTSPYLPVSPRISPYLPLLVVASSSLAAPQACGGAWNG